MYWKWLVWQQTTSDIGSFIFGPEHPDIIESYAKSYIDHLHNLLLDDAIFWRELAACQC